MTTTVTYRYLVPDEGPTTATWTGNRTDALQAAILALDAKHDGNGWAHHPEELREELDALYDPWCAATAATPSGGSGDEPEVALATVRRMLTMCHPAMVLRVRVGDKLLPVKQMDCVGDTLVLVPWDDPPSELWLREVTGS